MYTYIFYAFVKSTFIYLSYENVDYDRTENDNILQTLYFLYLFLEKLIVRRSHKSDALNPTFKVTSPSEGSGYGAGLLYPCFSIRLLFGRPSYRLP